MKILPIILSVFFFASIFSGQTAQSQNLVPNGSFDDVRGSRPSMKPWKKINTVDFFVNSDERRYKEVNAAKSDRNYILRQPRTGNAYVGLRVWPKYNEYLQIQLRKPLEEGKVYSFEMYITPSRYSNCYLKTIGASFYSYRPPYTTREGKEDFPPQVEVYRPFGIRDTSDWIRINGVFVAKGGEKLMTIGNFSWLPSDKFKRKKFALNKREAYYYVDDIAVYELDANGLPIKDSIAYMNAYPDTLLSDTNDFDNDITSAFAVLDSSITTILFTENGYKLDDLSYRKLGVITEYLLENPSVKIRIQAYAAPGELDGQEMKLAEKRGKSVYIFLTGNKIDRGRIEMKPIGNSCEFYKAGDPSRKYCRKVDVVILP
jgi:outer membrane protein OmpA-like peptidoglycan-associated protein